jgi:hypothetical protein
MDKMKQKYEKPLVKIKVISVEDGFGTSSSAEGYGYGSEISW